MSSYPQSIWRPGPQSKVNGGVNTIQGVVCHSMVGSFGAAMGELDKLSRRASWHYSVLQNGDVYAHYADEAQTWHAGSAYNNSTIGIEHEGGFSPEDEPLTDAQRDASVALVRWLSQAHGFPLVRGNGLWEHREVSDTPTACPSGRIPWEFYTEGRRMYTDGEVDAKIRALLGAIVEANKKLDALQTSVDFLIEVVNNVAPRMTALEQKP